MTVLRQIIQAPRPFEYDKRLKPLADRYASSYGFPSLESYMMVIISGYITWKVPSCILILLFMCLTLFIGVTRIYAGSRFFHQILGSWLLGLLGLQFTQSYVKTLSRQRLSYEAHVSIITLLVFAILGYVAYYVEMNESYVIKLPKEEYTRVLKMILDQDLVQDGAQSAAHDDDYDDASRSTPYEYEDEETQGRRRRGRRKGQKRDSFSFLEETFAKRRQRKQQIYDEGIGRWVSSAEAAGISREDEQNKPPALRWDW